MTEIDSKTLASLFPDFNIEEALPFAGGMPSLLVKIMQQFYAEYKDTAVSTLRTLLDSSDFAAAARHAHTLKGLSGNIGATKLREACLSMEMLCKSENPADGQAAAFNRFAEEMERTLSSLSAGLSKVA